VIFMEVLSEVRAAYVPSDEMWLVVPTTLA
jgi:hypothetical protein